MRQTLDEEVIQRVARAAVQFFHGKRRGTGLPAEHIASLSDTPQELVRRVFEEHWGVHSVSSLRLNMTKQQYERILREAAHGVQSLQRTSAPLTQLLSAVAREVDASDLSHPKKQAAKRLLGRLADTIDPAREHEASELCAVATGACAQSA